MSTATIPASDVRPLPTERIDRALVVLDSVPKLPGVGTRAHLDFHGPDCWQTHRDCLAAHVAEILRGGAA